MTRYLSAEEIQTLGILQEVNRTFFHPIGLAAEVRLDTGALFIQDWRDDPEGVIYEAGVMEPEKYKAFRRSALRACRTRELLLGFVVQQPPDAEAAK